MSELNLTKGTRIYYGGDRANRDGKGTITGITTDKWGVFVDILMDDKRKFHIPKAGFSSVYKGHGGTRFVTLDAYNNFKREQFKQMGIPGFKEAK